MPLVTITRVAEDHRTFETQNGKFAAFKVWAGDDVGEVVTKADTLDKRLADFRAIVGKPTELIVEDQGTFSDGNPKPKKIKFPQQGQGGGGKGSYVPRWTDTEEGAKWADDRIDRRRALELAVQVTDKTYPATLTAEQFYKFLKKSAPVEPVASTSQEGRSRVDGKAGAAAGAVGYGEGLTASASSSEDSDVSSEQAGAVSAPAPATPEQEQAEAYIQVLREGPGNTQAVLQARALFESDARKIKNLRSLSVDELFAVIDAFKQKVAS